VQKKKSIFCFVLFCLFLFFLCIISVLMLFLFTLDEEEDLSGSDFQLSGILTCKCL